ncbi:copper-binding protein [Lysobacter sp. A3-1-A15]|uniref:copper-binding protein n=1 Tax=Novilysobacter viscosus TaxID=3098602 RepID=UPI002ED960F1
MKILIAPLLSVALLAGCSKESAEVETATAEPAAMPSAGTDARSMGMSEADHQAMATGNAAAAGTAAAASGTVVSIEPAANRIVLAHGPVEALEWPAMEMGFIATPEQVSSLRVGQKVDFEFLSQGPNNTITSITPAE